MEGQAKRSFDDAFYAIVTGANSGLGYAICCRLIDEFLLTRPATQRLVLVITTRSKQKAEDTVRRLHSHLRRAYGNARSNASGASAQHVERVRINYELLDLTSILSIRRSAEHLVDTIPKLDALILNAGIGGWIGINWPVAIYTILTDWVHSVTWPSFKITGKGWVAKSQLPSKSQAPNGNAVEEAHGGTESEQEPPLGEVFCANLFGHYLLAHFLMPILSAHDETSSNSQAGRIIWLSSLEAYDSSLKLDDFQAIPSQYAYESSKRITDTLALTYDFPSTKPWVDRYVYSGKAAKQAGPHGRSHEQTRPPPRMYLAHPGICSTGIFPLPYILGLCMTAAFYIARFLGSLWHTCTPYAGACAPVWLALAEQSTLDDMEAREGRGKWGSATDIWGHDRVARTEVEGWGWEGKVGEEVRTKGRWRYAKDLTEEARQDFEVLGRECWKEMEKLRGEWESRLGIRDDQ